MASTRDVPPATGHNAVQDDSLSGSKRKRMTDGATLRGHLQKQGGSKNGQPRRWKRRYFILRDSKLLYFKSKRLMDVPQGEFDISEATVRDSGVPGVTNSFVLCCRPKPVGLAAACPADVRRWTEALRTIAVPPDELMAEAVPAGLPVLLVLECKEGPFKGQRFEVGQEGVVVMRLPGGISAVHMKKLGKLQLPDDDVSRSHAEIKARAGRFEIKDSGSLNGTLINGKRLSAERKPSDWSVINGGDVVEMGKSKFEAFYRIVVPEEDVGRRERHKWRQERRRRRQERREARAQAIEAQRAKRETGGQATDFLARVLTGQVAPGAKVAGYESSGYVSGGYKSGYVSGGYKSGYDSCREGRKRPNTAALGFVIGNVIEHNVRVEEEEKGAAAMLPPGQPPRQGPPPPPMPRPWEDPNFVQPKYVAAPPSGFGTGVPPNYESERNTKPIPPRPPTKPGEPHPWS